MSKLVAYSCLDAGESKFAVSSPILLLFKMIINHPLCMLWPILCVFTACLNL